MKLLKLIFMSNVLIICSLGPYSGAGVTARVLYSRLVALWAGGEGGGAGGAGTVAMDRSWANVIRSGDQGRPGRAVVVRAWPGHRNIGRVY